jgi:putative glycosyltransferase (TIGR04348 family)
MVPKKRRIAIISPALKNANNGNWQTAQRWRRFLRDGFNVLIAGEWDAAGAADVPDAMIALHARRSAESIARFANLHPERPLIVVLTGTDLYHDIRVDARARHSLKLATSLVVLQEEAVSELPRPLRSKCRVIHQSAPALKVTQTNRRTFDLIMVGHMREEKDPLTAMRALELVPAGAKVRLFHIGSALEPRFAEAARKLGRRNADYRWLGPMAHAETRQRIKRASAMVIASRMEGGANVVIEAVTSQVPVLASAIPGNVGLLGRDYAGYFPVGDALALATLIGKARDEPEFLALLRRQCAKRATLFAPQREQRELIRLVRSSLRTNSRQL